MSDTTGAPAGFVGMCKEFRQKLDANEKHLKEQIEITKREDAPEGANKGEMIANLMLAFRSLEDARMRMGKAIQAHEGGESVYDKTPQA